MKRQVLFFINHNNRFSQFLKRYWKRLDKIARGHNINPKVFITLWIISFVLRWGIVGVGIASVATLNGSTVLIFLILNRLVGLIVPIYIFIRGRGIRWYVYVTYITLILMGIFGAEYGMKFLAYIIDLFR